MIPAAIARTGNWSVRGYGKFLALVILASCTTTPPSGKTAQAPKPVELHLEKTTFNSLTGWYGENDDALNALKKSCPQLIKRGTSKPAVTEAASWVPFCAAIQSGNLKSAVEKYLQPYHLVSSDDSDGLFTGYYEPLIKASRTRDARYTAPIYKRPADLIEVNLGDFRDSLKGQKIIGRVDGRKLTPYYDRAAIANGALADKGDELLWADSEVDVFFLEVQGSGRAQLPDGSTMRIGYDAQNGYSYTAIGRVLKDSGEIESPVTMPKIRQWLAQNPGRMREILDQNQSNVFFKELKQDSAVGAANVTLTPEHSLAVDPAFYSYNLPLWLSTTTPDGAPFDNLMVAQDTGGAIKGAIRGDVFWGFGPRAEYMAGGMQQQGKLYILLPKEVRVD